MKNFSKFFQNWRNFIQKFRKKGEWKQRNSLYFLESLNLDICLSKTKIKTIFLIPNSTLDKLSNDTSLNSLRWMNRSAKIDWTKKNPVEYIVPPPPQEGSEQLKNDSSSHSLRECTVNYLWTIVAKNHILTYIKKCRLLYEALKQIKTNFRRIHAFTNNFWGIKSNLNSNPKNEISWQWNHIVEISVHFNLISGFFL